MPIPNRQNEDAQLRLLSARQEIYAQSKRRMIWQLILTVLLPFAAGVMGVFSPDARPYAASVALLIAILDVTWIDRRQREALKLAAKIGEAFDEVVLDLPWNPFVAGERAEREAVSTAAKRWTKGTTKLVNWYPSVAALAPHHMARIICQRSNLRYDAALRRTFGSIVMWMPILLGLILLIGGVWAKVSLTDFVTTVLAPFAPIIIWCARERFRQIDTADFQDVQRKNAEALWKSAVAGQCDEIECLRQSRELQNAIYTRRATSPLILPGVYWLKRGQLEDEMEAAAIAMLDEIGIKVPTTP